MPSPNYYEGAKDATVPPYELGPASTLSGNDIAALVYEFRRLQSTVVVMRDLVPQVATAAPRNPVNGMIRYAKAPWNPLGTGNRWVQYLGGAWVAFP